MNLVLRLLKHLGPRRKFILNNTIGYGLFKLYLDIKNLLPIHGLCDTT
jgi:hypothetical protein